jgi:hypothetical protein
MNTFYITLNYKKSNLVEISLPYITFADTYEQAIESIMLLAQERVSIMGGEIISIL